MTYTPDEMMAVAAARTLRNGMTCFVGIGLPSEAANLARRLHAPGIVLVYESGTIGAKPGVLPLSIGDGELAETADAVVPVHEIFMYWLQGGRIDVGFLGAAQIDRHGNLNSTVIGPYDRPSVRLPGAGGAPEIATGAREVFVMARQRPTTFVSTLDFLTTPARARDAIAAGIPRHARGVVKVITDLGIMEPDPADRELVLVQMHQGVDVDAVRAATGWPLRIAEAPHVTPPPTTRELEVLRALRERTREAHAIAPFRTRSQSAPVDSSSSA